MTDTWRVVLETRDPNGAPYHNIYSHVVAKTREAAIDYMLEGFGFSGGVRRLIEGWYIVSAWAVPESAVGESVRIVPINQPVFRREPDVTPVTGNNG